VVLRNAAVARMVPACADIPLPFLLDAAHECREIADLLVAVLSGPAQMIESREVVVGRSTYMVNTGQVVESNGEVLGAVAVLRDITALKKLETAKSMFVSMVAHELKNPIAVVEGYLNLILEGVTAGDPEQEKKIIQRSQVRIQTLRILVTELLSLTAIESGKFNLKRLPLGLAPLVTDAIETYQPKAQEKRIRLTCRDMGDDARMEVLADKEAVRRIIGNLVDNAVKYTPEDGRVTVAMDKSGMFIKVSVKDSGIGMTADEQKGLFEEFYRVKNEYTSQVAGTGLGLSLVKKLVELHQGKITVESAEGQGSTFSVYLPLA
jgi:signal transduction histidine kinase